MHQLPRLFGAVTLVAAALFTASASPSWAIDNPTCSPDISTSTEATRRPAGAITDLDVTTQAQTSSVADNRLTSVRLLSAVNSSVSVDGQPVAVPTTISLPSSQAWTFRAHRLDVGQPFKVDSVVRDSCGNVSRFVGSGTGDGRASPPSQDANAPTATRTPAAAATTTTTTATPTLTAGPTRTPTVTATVTATATATTAASSNPADVVVPGTLRLTTTFASIGIEVPLTGDANQNATATHRFHRVGDTIWRNGLDLWLTNDPSGAAFLRPALLLEPGTAYEIRVNITDPDGVSGNAVQTATITTRAETIAQPSTLVPGYFVRVTGSDTADGRSEATAWRTIDKAIKDAPSGAIVQVGPGYFPTARAVIGGWTYARTLPLTLIAQYPAVSDDRQPINLAQRTVIEPVGLSSPTGAADGPNPGVWQQVTLTGPRTGAAYTVWAWTGSPVSDATQLGYATTCAAAPIRVAHWKKDALDLASPAGWAEKVSTNLTYNAGFYATGQDLYVRLPGGLNPNTLYMTASNKSHTALAIYGPDIRVSGFEVRQFASGVNVLGRATHATVDRSLLTRNAIGVAFRGDRRPPDASGAVASTYGSDHVVQDNLILDSSLRMPGPGAALEGSYIPWMFIKVKIREADGSEYALNRVGGLSESNGVSGRGGALRVVVRRNTIDGPYNGVSPGYNEGFDRHAGQDMDVHDNTIRHIADDALEPELATINFRAWNNRIEDSLTVLSTGPVNFGPLFLFRNTAVEIGNDGVAADGQGRAPGSAMLKYSGKSTPPALVYVLHNAFWTDCSADGGAQFAFTGSSPEAFYLRNNVFRTARCAFEAPAVVARWDEDCSYFGTTDGTRGLSYSGNVYRGNVQAYRDASGQGGCTNQAEGFVSDVQLVDPVSGNVRLPPGSPLIDAGQPVPNLSDRAGIDFQGAGPDIGAFERGP